MHTRIDRSQKARQDHPSRHLVEKTSGQAKDALDPIQLLEAAAHDLRNPLSGILAASQYLLEDARSVLADHQLAMLGSIEAAGRSMLGLIDDLMELSEIESGKLRLNVKSTALHPLLARALSSSRGAADGKQVQLDMQAGCCASLLPLEIDSEKVFRALERLLAGTVMLTLPGGRIVVGVESGRGRVTVSFRVDGPGVPAAAVRSLFHPFRKGRISRSSVEGGTPMAFARVRRIVEAHGGTIRVDGGAEKELTIKLMFPLSKRTAVHRVAAGAG